MRLVEFSLAHRIPVACFHAIKSTKFKRQWNLLLHRNLLFQVSFCIYWLTFICTDTTLSEKEYIPTAPYLTLTPNAGLFFAISRYIL